MPEHTAAINAKLAYETSSHVDGAKYSEFPPSAGTKWSVFSAVDSDGHTLGDRFRFAMERLERLLYAIYGARPASYSPYQDWTWQLNPRCLWGPEQWVSKWCPSWDIYGNPICSRSHWEVHETAADGSNYQNKAGLPQVPIRSRSGDWRKQTFDTSTGRTFDREHFPLGAVERDEGYEVFDPRGAGDFGGDPARVGTHGPVHIAGEAVEVRYTPPGGKTVVSAALIYATSRGGGGTLAMTLVAGVYKATIPAQLHDTMVSWSLAVTFQGDPNYIRNDPATGPAYTYRAFSHWNPYPHGLPEPWAYSKKGTDSYQFSHDETIQPALLNLVRFTLDYVGERFNHNPKNRAQLPACCIEMPIRFRWSGSAPYPYFVAGGKGGTAHPIHNRDSTPVTIPPESREARRSWRGIPYNTAMLYDNRAWGQGASWLSMPSRIANLERWAAVDPGSCAHYWTGMSRGLREGDVISSEHIEELIAAVDYLVDTGLWVLRPIKRRMLTPTWSVSGYDCGAWRRWGNACEEPTSWEYSWYDTDYACCMELQDLDEDGIYETCIPFPAPASWQDCWNNHPGKCVLLHYETFQCAPYWCGPLETHEKGTLCGGGQMVSPRELPSCGYIPGGAGISCLATHLWQDMGTETRDNSVSHCGWAAYVCGPQRCVGGCDQYHGNNIHKQRYDHECPYPNMAPTGLSAGNCFGEAWSCARRIQDGMPSDGDVGFQTVRQFYFRGGSSTWDIGVCDNDCGSERTTCYEEGDIPDPPGLADKMDWHDPPQNICTVWCPEDPWGIGAVYASVHCEFGMGGLNACMEDKVWVALDLGVNGHPYTQHGASCSDYAAERMPTLAAYDHSPGPEYYDQSLTPPAPRTTCPCETGAVGGCV